MSKGLLKKRIAEYIREQKEAQKRDEARKRDEERIRLEGEVANLFYEYDTIYDKIRYMPKVDELLEFLNDKNNAAGFWQNPHVKMLYNISDHHNFLLSIYTEETNSQRYEEWLKQNFSNPFFNNMAVNPEMLKTIAEADSKNYDKILYDCIDSLCRIQAEHRRYTIFEGDYLY